MYIKYHKENFEITSFIQEMGSFASKISGNEHKDGILTLYFSDFITPQEQVDIGNIVEAHVGTPVSPLRIFRVLPMNEDPLIADFSILGFRKEAPYYDRGRKVSSRYMCVEEDEVIVEKIFKDIYDEDGYLKELEIKFNWYDENNQVALTKTEIAKRYHRSQAKTEMRRRRFRAMDFLEAEAEGTPLEPIMLAIKNFFYQEQLNWKNDGTTEFRDAILNVTDPTISAYLNILVPLTSMPHLSTEIKNSILFQIGHLSPAEFMTTTQPTPGS